MLHMKKRYVLKKTNLIYIPMQDVLNDRKIEQHSICIIFNFKAKQATQQYDFYEEHQMCTSVTEKVRCGKKIHTHKTNNNKKLTSLVVCTQKSFKSLKPKWFVLCILTQFTLFMFLICFSYSLENKQILMPLTLI